ncbi:unnamed protein product [Owenia fusiformis]|uniref:Uncharacterized protein n=1 Tax=Owenia fusiformis TaxID=6347 RepID=A0A8J1TVA5_OWEFU|nr:unnamed protein product [Owenia fusiformis]
MSVFGALFYVISNNITPIFVCVAIFLLARWLTQPKDPWILPPGPFAWPIIGNLNKIMPKEGDNSGARRVLEIARQYKTDILSFKIGSTQAIVLRKFADVKEAFSKDEFTFVNPTGPVKFIAPGIIGTDGAQWKEQRRFALSTLRDFGLGKNKAQDIIQEELQKVVETFNERGGQPFNSKTLICNMVSNIICSLIFGHRFDYDDKTFQRILFCSDQIMNSSMRYIILGYLLPIWIKNIIPGDLFRIEYAKSLMSEIKRDIILKKYKEHVAHYSDDESRDYMDAFIKEMKTHKSKGKEHWFTEEQLLDNVVDLFFAGTDTSTTIIRWLFLYMANYQEIQEQVRAEIQDVLGDGRLPTMTDKQNMPFTEATILEVMRKQPVAELLYTRHTSDDATEFKGFLLPPRTLVIPNIYAIMNDPDHWTEPEKFNPLRFIGEDGQMIKDDHVLSFSIGKRQCLGEPLARMELFLFFVGIMQKFRIEIPPGREAPLKVELGSGVDTPVISELCFIGIE